MQIVTSLVSVVKYLASKFDIQQLQPSHVMRRGRYSAPINFIVLISLFFIQFTYTYTIQNNLITTVTVIIELPKQHYHKNKNCQSK